MDPAYHSNSYSTSWRSNPDARRNEFEALTLGMLDSLELLRQRLDSSGHENYPQSPALPAARDTIHSPHRPSDAGHQCWGISDASNENITTRDIYAPNPSLSSQYHAPHTPRTANSFPDRNEATGNSPHFRITNQPRSTSINRGGSNRREAPADKICDFCRRAFTRNERLRYHIQREHLQLEPEYECDVPGCNRAFRQRCDLLRHQRTVHRSLFPGQN